MRNFGGLLVVGGIVAFLYCSSELKKHEPVPEGLSISRSLEYPAGKMEVGRYAAMAGAAFGVLLLMFPQGR